MMMRWNSPTSGKVQVDGEELKEVLKFVYLHVAATVTQKGGSLKMTSKANLKKPEQHPVNSETYGRAAN